MILSKCICRPRQVLQAACCGGKHYVTQTDSEVSIKTVPQTKDKSLEKTVAKSGKTVKKRKYNIKQALESFSSLELDPVRKENITTDDSKRIGDKIRRNEVNIEMLPPSLHKNVFGSDLGPKISPKKLAIAQEHLKQHDLLEKIEPPMPEINFPLPPLQGKNIEEHFHRIAEEQCGVYRELVNKQVLSKIPEIPEIWSTAAGWTKYEEGKEPKAVPFPDEDSLVFDIEECMQSGLGPTLATALSPTAWYAWISKPLAAVLAGAHEPGPIFKLTPDDLINLESLPNAKAPQEESRPKVIVAHNASFDRARIKEQYWLKGSKMRFIDTMSLHVCVSGVSSFQKAQLVKKTMTKDEELLSMEMEDGEVWREKSSLNNLGAVHKLYCNAGELDKSTRDLFVTGNLSMVALHFQEAVRYCATDVKATQEVLSKLFPLFLTRFPHPATFSGMLELSVAYLPVSQAWGKYIEASNHQFNVFEKKVKDILAKAANQACALLLDDKYKDDPWMWDQDWSIQQLKMKKTASKDVSREWDEEDRNDPLAEKFKYLAAQRAFLPARKPHLPGYPAWYRSLCPRLDLNSDDPDSSAWRPAPSLMSSSMQVTPKLMRLTWDGYPLHKVKDHGWGFLIPGRPESRLDSADEVEPPVESLMKMCPRPAQGYSGMTVNSTDIADVVEKKISKSDFYGARKTRGIPAPAFYKGAGLPCPDVALPGVWFQRMPHPGGTHLKVGNPLSKDFISRLSEGTLKGDGETGKVLEISNNISYWKNNRERVESQQVVWLDPESLPKKTRTLLKQSKSKNSQLGAILPQLVIAGTLTRRAVERTWLTASNAELNRIGSELRAMVHAPPGYHMVGADVDSQELWLAALLGDASSAGLHGATAFGWRTLQGKKSDGTDLHSITAKAAGASRQHAKIMNYARIYGAGMNFAHQLLKRFSPEMSDEQTRKAATNTLTLTKGKRLYAIPVNSFKILFDKGICTAEQEMKVDVNAKILCTSMGNKFGFISETGDILLSKPELDMLKKFEAVNGIHYSVRATSKAKSVWYGGTESAMFNRLEEIANSSSPVTPFLDARLSRALEPSVVGTYNYLTTRVNWVVQSSAVDFLHLMLVSMRWLLGDKVDWRFILSFHDEVRYLVPSDKRYEAALALHATNLLARAFCARRLGIHDLPHSVAFFSGVEVDTAMRKDASSECITPSNPEGMTKGYGVPQGETLDVYGALKKTGPNVFAELRKQKKFSIYAFCGMPDDYIK